MLRLTPAAVVVCVLLTACAATTRDDLNDSTRSALRPDPVSLRAGVRPRLFETRSAQGIAVSYNLSHKERAGSVLRLTLHNQGDSSRTFSPVVRVTDASGYDLVPYTFMALVRLAARVSEAPVPDAFYALAAERYNPGATDRDVVQARSDATSFPAFRLMPSGINDGGGAGDASPNDQRQQDASTYLAWLRQFWLSKSYTLAPGQTVSAFLAFPDRAAALPLQLDVDLSGVHYRFTTISQAR